MSYKQQYGMPMYGPPPGFGAFPGSGVQGPPPGMSAAPGMAPHHLHQVNAMHANRAHNVAPMFQPPANLPNINFDAPVIRLGTTAPKLATPTYGSRNTGDNTHSAGGRGTQGLDRAGDLARSAARDSTQSIFSMSPEDKLRTIFLHKIPDSLTDSDVERILASVGMLRKWDSARSTLSDTGGLKFGFALFGDAESVANALELLQDVEVPLRKAPAGGEQVEKVKLQWTVDPATQRYVDHFKQNGKQGGSTADSPEAVRRLEASRENLKVVLQNLSAPEPSTSMVIDGSGDTVKAGVAPLVENVEVINIPLAQDDELADIPAEMREVVSAEITAFRERSTRRDMERLKREQELELSEQQHRNGSGQRSFRADPSSESARARGIPNAPSGPKGHNARRESGINGYSGLSGMGFAAADGDYQDTDVSDGELNRRQLAKQKAEDDRQYLEAERKWINRERSRAAALAREADRESVEKSKLEQRREEQVIRERTWDDEKEAIKKSSLYYRDHAGWLRKRMADRADEEERDDADRRVEEDEHRREMVELERVKGLADSFLDREAVELERRERADAAAAATAAAAAPQQPFKLSLGAAAQRAQRAGPLRRTVAEVEGLLDDEEQGQTTRRQFVPIQFEPMSATKSMTEEEISAAVRALAQEIPSDREALWAWEVQWDQLHDSVLRDKLRPFVEKKVLEYLGVQEQMLVSVVEEHLRRHGKPGELVEELAEALDDDAEDLVRKLWRMVIFFSESEKRGLPA